MKCFLYLLVLNLAIASCNQDSTSNANEENVNKADKFVQEYSSGSPALKKQLIQSNRDIIKALINADKETVKNMLAETYQFVSDNGEINDKEQFVNQMSTGPIKSILVKDTLMMLFRIYGTSGVVTGMWVATSNNTTTYLISTNVFYMQRNGWKLVSTHSSKIPVWQARKMEDVEFEVLKSSGCEEEANLKSSNSEVQTLIRIKNNTSNSISAYWITFEGKRDREDQIKPISAGQSRDIKTYFTHPFVIIDARGKCMGIYKPSIKPGIIYIQHK